MGRWVGEEPAEPTDDPLAGLSDQHRRFVLAYVGEAGFNARKAAQEAGYSMPEWYGPALRKRADIDAAIERFLSAKAMEAGEVLARLADVARGTIEDLIDIEERPVPEPPPGGFREGDRCPRCERDQPESATRLELGEVTNLKMGRKRKNVLICRLCGDRWNIEQRPAWKLNLAKAKAAQALGLIHKISYDRNGNPTVELEDRLKALEMIGRHLKLFTDRTELTGSDGEPLVIGYVVRPPAGAEDDDGNRGA